MPSKVESEPSDIKKYPPILRIDSDDLPIVAKAKVGAKYKLCIDVTVVSLSTGEEYGEQEKSDKGKTMASLKVTSVGQMDAPKQMKPNMMAEAMKRRV